MRLVRNLLEDLFLVLIVAALAFAFHHFGDLNVPASIMLGGGFTIIGLWLRVLWRVAAFEPYRIEIYVNFDALRTDLGLTPDNGQPDADKKQGEMYVFTAINAALFAFHRGYKTAEEPQLADVEARARETYRSRIGFAAKIPCALDLAEIVCIGVKFRDPHPKFFFREVLDGYQFGIQVIPEWWSEHSKALSQNIRDMQFSFGEEIILASIPRGYIPGHVRRWYRPVSLLYPFDWKQRRWKSKLEKLGWRFEDDLPGYLRHRYLNVSFSVAGLN